MSRKSKNDNNFLLDITVFLRRLIEISMDWHKGKKKKTYEASKRTLLLSFFHPNM